MNRSAFVFLATASVLYCNVSLVAQDAGSSSSGDKTFVMMADEGNSAEIAASKMALKKSRNPEVKAYAQKMIDDHMKLRSDMAPFATTLGVTTPQPLNEAHKAEAQRLASMSGEKFDLEYVNAMDQDHHKTLDMFKNEESTTSNQDLKGVVQQGEQVVQMHTDMADQMAQKMNIPVAPSASQ